MKDTTLLNFKLKELSHLVNEIQSLAPNPDALPNEWNNIFYHIDELERNFRIVSINGTPETIQEAELIISGDGCKQDFLALEQSLMEEFPEFSFDESYASQLPESFSGDFQLHYKGFLTGDAEDFIKLTTHALALFEDTGVANILAKVCVDGEWYGRQNNIALS